MKITIEQTAKICHEANKAYCEALGDMTQKSWDESSEWQHISCIAGIKFCLDNPSAGPEASHNSWLEHKRNDGWTYGAVKDAEKKQHPCFVSFEELPVEQQIKNKLFKCIVDTIRNLL